MENNVHAITPTKRILAIPSKLQMHIPFHPAILVLGFYPTDLHTHMQKNIY